MKLGEVEGLFYSTPARPVPPPPPLQLRKVHWVRMREEGGRGRGEPIGAAGGDAGSIFQKLKDGRKSVVLAVLDGGVISFIRLGDVGFGEVS